MKNHIDFIQTPGYHLAMKYTITLLGLILCTGCSLPFTQPPTPDTPVLVETTDIPFKLSYQATKTINDITFTLTDVIVVSCGEEADTNCVPTYNVQLNVLDAAGVEDAIMLSTPAKQDDETLSLDQLSMGWEKIGRYSVALEAVKPKSNITDPLSADDYQASFVLTERDLSVSEDAYLLGKPVLYLYPPTTQDVSVRLDFPGKIIASYPDYDNRSRGWKVRAYPDGHLINASDQQEYSYLFWEGVSPNADFNMGTGFVVAGQDTKTFLQNILPKIGLLPKEYNEFIVYWYPILEKNPYNLIHFATDEYTAQYPLTITPAPNATLRVFMVYKPLVTPIDITSQEFKPFVRQGFTVVEWGGRGIIKE